MGIVWLFIGVVVLAVVVPLARSEVRLRRRAVSELPEGLSGSALRRARRQKIADWRYLSRSLPRPGGNTSDGIPGIPGGAFDGGGHGGGGGGHG